MVSAPLNPTNANKAEDPLWAIPILGRGPRLGLLSVGLGLVIVFVIACRLNPYENGQPLRLATHQQLGLPPCTFKEVTGYPCPSCGMTTSFSLLVRGDVVNSLRANAVGTLLALFWAALIPWCLLSACLARPLWILTIERALLKVVMLFLTLLLVRWIIVLGLQMGSISI